MITEDEYQHQLKFVKEVAELTATKLAPFGSVVAAVGGCVAIGVIPEPNQRQVLTDSRFLLRLKAAAEQWIIDHEGKHP